MESYTDTPCSNKNFRNTGRFILNNTDSLRKHPGKARTCLWKTSRRNPANELESELQLQSTQDKDFQRLYLEVYCRKIKERHTTLSGHHLLKKQKLERQTLIFSDIRSTFLYYLHQVSREKSSTILSQFQSSRLLKKLSSENLYHTPGLEEHNNHPRPR